MNRMVQSNTKDIRLFSAIASMGISFKEQSLSVDGGERVWLFDEISDCKRWEIGKLLAWWRDSTLVVKDSANSFNYPTE